MTAATTDPRPESHRMWGGRFAAASAATFDALNKSYFEAGWRAQFVSGMIMPMMTASGHSISTFRARGRRRYTMPTY